MIRSPDYSLIAANYDQRYQEERLVGVARLLRAIATQWSPKRIIEVACGTGHWLAQLPAHSHVLGIDKSMPMLSEAALKQGVFGLVQADAAALPLGQESADLLFCINALHHFPSPELFVEQAARAVVPNGNLLIVGANPHKASVDWYVYHYFEGVRALDESRFPSSDQTERWLVDRGFRIEAKGTAQPIRDAHIGSAVLETPFLRRRGCSQMALLSDRAYRAGIDRIRQAVEADPEVIFTTSIDLDFVLARRLAEP
ncbi:MAG: class I SAM-dependent methyltransferase [Anaerolineales bacterium]